MIKKVIVSNIDKKLDDKNNKNAENISNNKICLEIVEKQDKDLFNEFYTNIISSIESKFFNCNISCNVSSNNISVPEGINSDFYIKAYNKYTEELIKKRKKKVSKLNNNSISYYENRTVIEFIYSVYYESVKKKFLYLVGVDFMEYKDISVIKVLLTYVDDYYVICKVIVYSILFSDRFFKKWKNKFPTLYMIKTEWNNIVADMINKKVL